jgi:hypothetical protein
MLDFKLTHESEILTLSVELVTLGNDRFDLNEFTRLVAADNCESESALSFAQDHVDDFS